MASTHSGAEELTRIRRDIHRHPELGFQETRTAELVARYLTAQNIDVYPGVGRTGVVGLIRGKGASDRMIGLRADMDALPMQEETGLDYASGVPGVFHGCGHDGHVAMLLGAARRLAENRDFAGTIAVIFQPAEEGLGGARAMVADGLFRRFACDEIYGLHNSPLDLPSAVGLWNGASHAGADFFDIHIAGTGSHAATPHQGRDPILMATSLVQSLQSVVSMNSDAQRPLVLSVTRIEAGSAYNVIPRTATIAGTLRYLDEESRALARDRIQTLAQGLAMGFEVAVEVAWSDMFDIVVNEPRCVDAFARAATEVVGAANVSVHSRPMMGSEDFGEMLRVVPGAFCTLGHAGNIAVHNPRFIFDDGIIPVGASLLAGVALQQAAA